MASSTSRSGSGGRAAPTTTLGRLVDVDVPQGSGVMWVFALPSVLPQGAPNSASAAPARAIPVAPTLARPAPAATRVASSGVFSAAQAQRGEQLFNKACVMCHSVADHTGGNFTAKWSASTLGDIFDQLATTMPPANPGSLNPDGYASLLAFFLSRSGFTPGGEELPLDRNSLRAIRVGAP